MGNCHWKKKIINTRVYLIDNFKSLETEKLLFSFNIPPSHSAYSYSAKNLVQLHESQGEA